MSKNIKSVLATAVTAGSAVKIGYTDLKGATSVRTVVPQEFVAGTSGESVVAVDNADGGTRRFLIAGINAVEA